MSKALDELKVVYFDPDVTNWNEDWVGGSWIFPKDNAEKISTFFEGKGFVRKSSAELGNWMRHVICTGKATRSILIFAQDVAPYQVFDDLSSSCLVRQYLDECGTVLWIGDIPFYYRTTWIGEESRWVKVPAQAGGIQFVNVLGVIPVSMIVDSRSALTKKGKKLGLKTPWPSSRPIVFPSQTKTDRTRVMNCIRHRREFIELAHTEGAGVPSLRPLIRTGHIRRLSDFLGTESVKVGPVEVSLETKNITGQTEIEFSTKYASAWIKIFNPSSNGSGFIRVWDYFPGVITDSMLGELYSVLTKYCGDKIKEA